MKILVTGMSSRQANPDASRKDVTFAKLLADALRDSGHEVEHRNPSVAEDLSSFDHAFVGIGPLHGMGTNRSYGSLSVILRMWPSKLTIFSDDMEMGKVVNGIKTVLADPDARFTKPFFNYKLDWDVASQPQWREWLLSGVQLLNDYQWPRLLLPAFPWADLDYLVKKVPNARGTAVGLDLSAYLPKFDLDLDDELARDQLWVVEAGPDDKWLPQQRLIFDVERYGKGADKRPWDEALVRRYSQVWGVVEPPVEYGWWTSRPGYAAQARALYVTKWQNVAPLGDAYSLLPDAAAGLDHDLRNQWAEAQAGAFEQHSSSREDVAHTLKEILGE